MESKLKQIENEINLFNVKQVNLDTILQIKQLSDQVKKLENEMLWDFFKSDIESLELGKFNIKLDSSIQYKKEVPKNVILKIKEAVNSTKRLDKDEIKIKEYTDFSIELSKLYIKHEDYQEEVDDKTLYLYNLIDEKFGWLDDNKEFIKISELLDKVSKEICDGVSKHVENKRKFYEDYFQENFKNLAFNNMSTNSELYVCNFIKNYILNNFGPIFNQVCLDVLELNGINDEKDIKKIIGLYWDYTKTNTKLMLTLNDIDKRIKMYEAVTGDKVGDSELEDGQMKFDDKGIRCYWDNEIKGWLYTPDEVSERLWSILKKREDFEGFDTNANDELAN